MSKTILSKFTGGIFDLWIGIDKMLGLRGACKEGGVLNDFNLTIKTIAILTLILNNKDLEIILTTPFQYHCLFKAHSVNTLHIF